MEHFLETGTHWRILNFVVFVGVLIFVLRRPWGEFWKGRADQIRSQVDEAKRLKAQEEGRYRALSLRVAAIEQEVTALVTSLREEGDLEKSRLISEAEQYAAQLRSDSKKIAEQEVRKARELLKGEAIRLSLELAERLIREKIGPEDQRGLAERYLSRLEGAA